MVKFLSMNMMSCDRAVWPVLVWFVGLWLVSPWVPLPAVSLSSSDLGQVVHTLVRLSPNSRPIIWYQPQGSDVARLGR